MALVIMYIVVHVTRLLNNTLTVKLILNAGSQINAVFLKQHRVVRVFLILVTS